MSNPVIDVTNLGKKYLICHQHQAPYQTLRESLTGMAQTSWERLCGKHQSRSQTEFWALQDVAFTVNQGDRLGIIGRNGAGKSTLLKILSRITEPSRGRIKLRGRVASLLEVGTGFHPELTGRENIFLNGAILGMSKQEILRKFEEIVDFAEVEQFLDTPVKRYSSGMYVRLAFAVAAHLEPEILIVDEVLAVGDAQFQQKCLGKMRLAGEEGRTIIFVSHNMAVLPQLCNRGLLLDQGRVALDQDMDTVVDGYLQILEQASQQDLATRGDRRGLGEIRLTQVEYFGGGNPQQTVLASGQAARFVFHLSQIRPGLSCAFTLYNQYNQAVANFDSANSPGWASSNKISCDIDELLLTPGKYRLNFAVKCQRELQDHVEAATMVEIEPGLVRGQPVGSGYGNVCLPHVWDFSS